MKLYKFRPLANITDFRRLEEILTTEKFWCSQFSDLNDPMEGSFRADNSYIVDEIYIKKTAYKICSFSGEKALLNPINWGYYANGFKGVAVELEVLDENIKEIRYKKNILYVGGLTSDEIVERILTYKLVPWKHEQEHRFLIKNNENKIKIGNITALYWGDPYSYADNRREIYKNSATLRRYKRYRNKITKDTNLNLFSARIRGCEVRISPFESRG